jgi:hypothetical protein
MHLGTSGQLHPLASALFDRRDKGGLTAEAAQFFDKYNDLSGAGAKVKELFGIDVSAIR